MNHQPYPASLRKPGHNYSNAGAYFITITTKEYKNWFGSITNGRMIFSEYGTIANEELIKTGMMRDFLLKEHVIMPNHVHFIAALPKEQQEAVLRLSSAPVAVQASKQFIPALVQAYKAAVSRRLGFSPWQRSYRDSIIECPALYQRIEAYIQTNAATWESDCFYRT